MAEISVAEINDLLSVIPPPIADFYLRAYDAFTREDPPENFSYKGLTISSSAFLGDIVPDLILELNLADAQELYWALNQIVTQYPEQATNSISQDRLNVLTTQHEDHLKELEKIKSDAVKQTRERIAKLSSIKPIATETAIDEEPQEIDPKEIATKLAKETISQNLDQLPLNDRQKERIKAILSEHETGAEIADILLSHVSPDKPLSAKDHISSEEQIKDKLYQRLGSNLSPTAINFLTSELSPLTATAGLLVSFASATKDDAVLFSETPIFTKKAIKAQNEIENVEEVLTSSQLGQIISKKVDTDPRFRSLTSEQRLSVKRDLAIAFESLPQVRAGLTPDGAFDLIARSRLSQGFQNTALELSRSHKAAQATQTTQTVQNHIPYLTVLEPKALSVTDQGLKVAKRGGGSLTLFRLPAYRQEEKNAPESLSENSVPSQISIFHKDGKISIPVPKNKAFEEIIARININSEKFNSVINLYKFKFDHSPVGIPIRKYNVLINRTIPRAVSGWVAKQGIVIAAKNASQKLAIKLAASQAGKIIVAAGVKIAAVFAEIGSVIAIPLAVLSILDLLKDLWGLIKSLGPLIKKFFDDHPWVFPLMLLGPLIPILGPFGFVLFGAGLLGILALLASGGTAALAGMGAGLGGILGGAIGLIVSFPVVFPILLAIGIFVGLWIFFVIFYEVFIIPQGFMSNLTSGQIAPLLSQQPSYFTVNKTADPSAISNSKLSSEPSITYTLLITPNSGYALTNIKVSETLTLIDGKPSPKPPRTLSPNYTLPSNYTPSQSAKYTLTLNPAFFNQNSLAISDFTDSIIRNEVVVTVDATGTKSNQTVSSSQTTSAAVTIGEPKLEDPCGWPIWGNFGNGRACVVQGPSGPYSHSGIEAVDIAGPPGIPVYSTHAGFIKWGYDPYDGNFVRVLSPDNSYQTIYAHLDNRTSESSTVVPKNTIVGYTTFDLNNGLMTGFHLHYQLRGTPSKGSSINKYLPPPAPINQSTDESSCSKYPVRNQDANNCPTN